MSPSPSLCHRHRRRVFPATDRDWEEIALLYEQLEQITRSPVVAMNRAIAVAELEGAGAALELLEEPDLDDYRYYHSTRADLLRRLGRDDEARAAYARALQLTEQGPEHGFLERRLADLSGAADGSSGSA